MRTRRVVSSKIRERGLRIIPAAALAASLAMLALGGCSSQNADTPPSNPVAVNFALDKCQQLDANLYKCPAVDQPICTPAVRSHRRQLHSRRPQGQRLRPARRRQPLNLAECDFFSIAGPLPRMGRGQRLAAHPQCLRKRFCARSLRSARSSDNFLDWCFTMTCPICKKPADMSQRNRFRPFCSERCQMIDLGTWVSGDYEKEDSQPAGHEHHDDLKKRRLLN